MALAQVAPATEQAGTYLAELLEPVAQKLRRLIAAPPVEFDADQRDSLWHALGLAASTLGEQRGESTWLEEAVAAYREALKERTRDAVPFHWALTQENLGLVFMTLGEREESPARLEDAAAAIRVALEVFERAGATYNVEKAKRNLARAEVRLNERRGGEGTPRGETVHR